jgi:large subunit ribosomal protein L22
VEASANHKYIRGSPRKVRLIADLVRGKSVEEALAMLSIMPQKAAKQVGKAVRAASSNAENNHDMVASELKIARIFANEGPTLKRFRPRSRGRVSPLLKRSSHITVVVSDEEELLGP